MWNNSNSIYIFTRVPYTRIFVQSCFHISSLPLSALMHSSKWITLNGMNDAVCENRFAYCVILLLLLGVVSLCEFKCSRRGNNDDKERSDVRIGRLWRAATTSLRLTNKIKCVTLNQRETAEPKTNHNQTHAQRTSDDITWHDNSSNEASHFKNARVFFFVFLCCLFICFSFVTVGIIFIKSDFASHSQSMRIMLVLN